MIHNGLAITASYRYLTYQTHLQENQKNQFDPIKYYFKSHLMSFGNARFDPPIKIKCKYEIHSFVMVVGIRKLNTPSLK